MKWSTVRRKVNDLLPYEHNPRRLTEKQGADLKASLTKFDLVEIPAINTDNVLIAGHQRMKIMQLLGKGEEEIDVRMPDRTLTEEELKEYNVRSNRNTGEWDFDILANNFDIKELIDWGFDEKALGLEFDKLIETEEDEVLEVDETKEPDSKLGEVYQLGRHRLMCGDATKIEDVEKLMDGKKADCVFTDPPYGIDIVNGGNVGITARVGFGKVGTKGLVPAREYSKVIGDDKPFDPTFLLGLSDKIILWGANNYSSKLNDNAQWLVWDKKAEKGSDHNNFSDCELAWTNVRAKSVRIYRFLWSGLLREGDRKTELSKRVHPTQKPVGLLADIIKDFTKQDDIVLDLFGGSGSTLIASEQTGRTCFMMELDPKYCDVIRKRYENYVNGKRPN